MLCRCHFWGALQTTSYGFAWFLSWDHRVIRDLILRLLWNSKITEFVTFNFLLDFKIEQAFQGHQLARSYWLIVEPHKNGNNNRHQLAFPLHLINAQSYFVQVLSNCGWSRQNNPMLIRSFVQLLMRSRSLTSSFIKLRGCYCFSFDRYHDTLQLFYLRSLFCCHCVKCATRTAPSWCINFSLFVRCVYLLIFFVSFFASFSEFFRLFGHISAGRVAMCMHFKSIIFAVLARIHLQMGRNTRSASMRCLVWAAPCENVYLWWL